MNAKMSPAGAVERAGARALEGRIQRGFGNCAFGDCFPSHSSLSKDSRRSLQILQIQVEQFQSSYGVASVRSHWERSGKSDVALRVIRLLRTSALVIGCAALPILGFLDVVQNMLSRDILDVGWSFVGHSQEIADAQSLSGSAYKYADAPREGQTHAGGRDVGKHSSRRSSCH